MNTIEPRKLLEILSVLDQIQPPAEMLNRRAFRRFAVRAQGVVLGNVSVGVRLQDAIDVAHVRDVSRGGMGLLLRGVPILNKPVRFVCEAGGLELFSMSMVARHTTELLHGVHLVGCAFAAESSLLLSMGVRPHELVLSEDQTLLRGSDGEFASVESLQPEVVRGA